MRICCIRSFGHFVARLQGSALQFSPEVGIFVSTAQAEREGLLQQAQAQFRMVSRPPRPARWGERHRHAAGGWGERGRAGRGAAGRRTRPLADGVEGRVFPLTWSSLPGAWRGGSRLARRLARGGGVRARGARAGSGGERTGPGV